MVKTGSFFVHFMVLKQNHCRPSVSPTNSDAPRRLQPLSKHPAAPRDPARSQMRSAAEEARTVAGAAGAIIPGEGRFRAEIKKDKRCRIPGSKSEVPSIPVSSPIPRFCLDNFYVHCL